MNRFKISRLSVETGGALAQEWHRSLAAKPSIDLAAACFVLRSDFTPLELNSPFRHALSKRFRQVG
jgi:hypothetical protein